MAVGEQGQVALGECRLTVSDGIQGYARIFNDALTVAVGNITSLFESVGLQSLILHPLGGRADLALRLEIDALIFKAAVIDPGVDIEFDQALIDMIGPGF